MCSSDLPKGAQADVVRVVGGVCGGLSLSSGARAALIGVPPPRRDAEMAKNAPAATVTVGIPQEMSVFSVYKNNSFASGVLIAFGIHAKIPATNDIAPCASIAANAGSARTAAIAVASATNPPR